MNIKMRLSTLIIMVGLLATSCGVTIPSESEQYSSQLQTSELSSDDTIMLSAKTASANELIKNLNTVLAIEEAITGKQSASYYDVIVTLDNEGYSVYGLNNNSWFKESVIYSLNTNRFILKDESLSTGLEQYYYLADEYDETSRYSFCCSDKFTDTTIPNLKHSFDAGKYTGIESITYVGDSNVGPQEILIRMNGGKLTIESTNADNIKVIGTCSNIGVSLSFPGQIDYSEVVFK